jgi:hypothetical protein
MQREHPGSVPRGAALNAPGISPGFEVRIDPVDPGAASRCFTVTGRDGTTGTPWTVEYSLPDTGHHAYLNFFEALARDFGTRVPLNRQPVPAPVFEVPFRPLLTRSLSPDILYGYGDPAVARVTQEAAGTKSATFFLVATSNDAPQIFPILSSPNLEDWCLRGFAFPQGHVPRWPTPIGQGGEYWAPELHQVGHTFLLCFAAREVDGSFSIGLARADSPEGPFEAMDEPILRGNVIDPHLLVSSNGRVHMFWKEDTNDLWPSRLAQLLHAQGRLVPELFPGEQDRCTAAFAQTVWPWASSLSPMERFFVLQGLIEAVLGGFPEFLQRLERLHAVEADHAVREAMAHVLRLTRTPVFGQELDPEELRLIGERVKVLQNDQPWEGHLVEGIWVTKQQGRYFMLYAGNDFSTARYGIGFAVADHPLGPYRKAAEPFLRSTAAWLGPGHPSVAMGPDGEPWLFLHAFFPGQSGYKEFRALLTLPIVFGEGGIELRG